MERKNVTIREDQSEWVDEAGINLSRLVQEAIDDRMEPTETELAEDRNEFYRRNRPSASGLDPEAVHPSSIMVYLSDVRVPERPENDV